MSIPQEETGSVWASSAMCIALRLSKEQGFTLVKGSSWSVKVREMCGCDASVTMPCLSKVTTWTERQGVPLETPFTKSTPVLTLRCLTFVSATDRCNSRLRRLRQLQQPKQQLWLGIYLDLDQ